MRIAVPNKGRLHEPTIELLERAGLHLRDGADRKLYADTVDPDVTVLFARAADIPEYVADGAAEVGITGRDQIAEADPGNVTDLLDLEFGECRLVLAAPEDGEITEPGDVAGGKVATEFPTITRNYLEEAGIDAKVVEVTGATELTPHAGMADAIVDITSTGTTLQVNRLAVIDEVLQSSVRLFAREDVIDQNKVEQIRTAMESVLDAEGKRYLMMNVPRGQLEAVREQIPGLGGPTVMDVADREEPASDEEDMLAVHVVVDERDVFETITNLKAAGASGILVTEIERLVE
ncbi:ATP phosphoribosyltransferase [Salinarchaeum sp. Harcht-Bsk1]|uniref:ATP phosphoribosyltransferase n=1 Tax=Salinarchaeum sp. Harcht-Bsk1 TaxID=1333523 RepID=UPI0003423216|nr:ATP phosphoribosyltransferase [Salinarchaeum sp. Harcht-Bsk1]AGN00507.1 ATP phosphoribosyltransferase [Salinarchaeum sp. Harcht-Bsk1]